VAAGPSGLKENSLAGEKIRRVDCRYLLGFERPDAMRNTATQDEAAGVVRREMRVPSAIGASACVEGKTQEFSVSKKRKAGSSTFPATSNVLLPLTSRS